VSGRAYFKIESARLLSASLGGLTDSEFNHFHDEQKVKRIGYTRTASETEAVAAQIEQLKGVGCTEIIHECATVRTRVRPKLTRAILNLAAGDSLYVTDLDSVAWSLPQLVSLLTSLHDRGIVFRALETPIGTSGPNGLVVLNTLRRSVFQQRPVAREEARRATPYVNGQTNRAYESARGRSRPAPRHDSQKASDRAGTPWLSTAQGRAKVVEV
jgi:hypothetical protein